jgi:hypothetical protein
MRGANNDGDNCMNPRTPMTMGTTETAMTTAQDDRDGDDQTAPGDTLIPRRTAQDDETHGTRPFRYEQLLIGRTAGASDDNDDDDETAGRGNGATSTTIDTADDDDGRRGGDDGEGRGQRR